MTIKSAGHGFGSLPSKTVNHAGYGDIYLAIVKAVNPEMNTMSVVPYSANMSTGEVKNNIRIAFPSVGNASGLVHYPEVGSTAVMAFAGGNHVPISYLPTGESMAPSYLNTVDEEKAKDTPGYKTTYKFRVMREGDVHLYAKDGPALALDTEAELSDGYGQYLRLRQADMSANINASVTRIRSSGVRSRQGYATRPVIDTMMDSRSPDYPGAHLHLTKNIDGSEQFYCGAPLAYNSSPSVEYRVEVMSAQTPAYDSLDDDDFFGAEDAGLHSPTPPLVEYVMGNFIGNDQSNAKEYGVFLKPKIFSYENYGRLTVNVNNMMAPVTLPKINEEGVAFGHRISGAYFSITDKAGAQHHFLGSSGGISREVYGEGSDMLAFQEGQHQYDKSYMRVVGNPGDNLSHKTLRWSVMEFAEGRKYEEAGGILGGPATMLRVQDNQPMSVDTEMSGYGRVIRTKGASYHTSTGYDLHSSMAYHYSSAVSYVVKSGGSYAVSSGGHSSISAMGEITLTSVTGSIYLKAPEISETFASGAKKNIALGSDSINIKVGSQTLDILTGNRTTNISAGNISDSVKIGKISRTVSAGNISDSANAGTYSNTSLKTSLSASLSFSIGAPDITLSGSRIQLGTTGLPSPVLTIANHFCNVTGLPPVPGVNGSLVVMAV